jgi:hypothetical protein
MRTYIHKARRITQNTIIRNTSTYVCMYTHTAEYAAHKNECVSVRVQTASFPKKENMERYTPSSSFDEICFRWNTSWRNMLWVSHLLLRKQRGHVENATAWMSRFASREIRRVAWRYPSHMCDIFSRIWWSQRDVVGVYLGLVLLMIMHGCFFLLYDGAWQVVSCVLWPSLWCMLPRSTLQVLLGRIKHDWLSQLDYLPAGNIEGSKWGKSAGTLIYQQAARCACRINFVH